MKITATCQKRPVSAIEIAYACNNRPFAWLLANSKGLRLISNVLIENQIFIFVKRVTLVMIPNYIEGQ